MYRLGLAWVGWRRRTGQINANTARDETYNIAYFTRAMGNRQPKQIGESDMERWRTSMLARGLAPSTVRRYWSTANRFLEWLVDEGKIRRNPARRIKSPKSPRTVHRNLRPDQSTDLHDACVDDRERLIVALSFQLGMRRCEIARAQIGDFDFVAMTVHVVGKGGNERHVALTVGAEKAINAYLPSVRSAGPLIRDVTGRRAITPGYVGDLFSAIAYRSGVKTRAWDGVGTHSGRHTAGTDVAHRTGGNAVIVRDFLGHANLSTTDIYVGVVDIEEQRLAIEGRRYAS